MRKLSKLLQKYKYPCFWTNHNLPLYLVHIICSLLYFLLLTVVSCLYILLWSSGGRGLCLIYFQRIGWYMCLNISEASASAFSTTRVIALCSSVTPASSSYNFPTADPQEWAPKQQRKNFFQVAKQEELTLKFNILINLLSIETERFFLTQNCHYE